MWTTMYAIALIRAATRPRPCDYVDEGHMADRSGVLRGDVYIYYSYIYPY